jgi:hypothetical protein
MAAAGLSTWASPAANKKTWRRRKDFLGSAKRMPPAGRPGSKRRPDFDDRAAENAKSAGHADRHLQPRESRPPDRRRRGVRAPRRRAAPLLARTAANLLCLQEVNAQKTQRHGPRSFAALDRLLAGGPYAGYHRAHTTRAKDGGPMDVHNLVLLSRHPIEASRQIHHDLVPAWTWLPLQAGAATAPPITVTWDRPLLHTRLSLDGGRALHV